MNIVEKIEHWRSTFGLPVYKTPQSMINGDDLDLSIDLVEEEYLELAEAINNNDIIEIADAIGDTYFVVVQLLNVLGIDTKLLIENIDLVSLKSNQVKTIVFNSFEILYEVATDDNLSNDAYLKNIRKFVVYYISAINSVANYYNIDINRVITEVYNSNMSKLVSASELKNTTEKYANQNIEVEFFSLDNMFNESGEQLFVVKNKETGKVLKSSTFVEPNLNFVLENAEQN